MPHQLVGIKPIRHFCFHNDFEALLRDGRIRDALPALLLQVEHDLRLKIVTEKRRFQQIEKLFRGILIQARQQQHGVGRGDILFFVIPLEIVNLHRPAMLTSLPSPTIPLPAGWIPGSCRRSVPSCSSWPAPGSCAAGRGSSGCRRGVPSGCAGTRTRWRRWRP